jgi:hypothetical protein
MNMNMNNNNMKGTAGSNGGMSSNMASSAAATAMMTTSGNNAIIKNITEYQIAQSLAAKAQEVFNHNLKPIAPSAASTSAANTQIQKVLSQLKTAIDNKAPFMDIMKIVHAQLHPTLITAYHLPLKSF